jgi:hypothetical protein
MDEIPRGGGTNHLGADRSLNTGRLPVPAGVDPALAGKRAGDF